jgi:hypothetical protein
MIITEELTVNGKAFTRTCSDSGYMVERDGVRYGEAIDPAELGRTYKETDETIEVYEMSETEEKAKAYDVLMGVAK